MALGVVVRAQAGEGSLNVRATDGNITLSQQG